MLQRADLSRKSIHRRAGHLGASLGVVELTVALHYVFNAPDDKVRCPRALHPVPLEDPGFADGARARRACSAALSRCRLHVASCGVHEVCGHSGMC